MAGFNKKRWAAEKAEEAKDEQPGLIVSGRAFKTELHGKTYLARITGSHPKFRFDREFERESESGGSKRNREWQVNTPGVFELQDNDGRTYFRVSESLERTDLTSEEVETLFPALAVQAPARPTAGAKDESENAFEASERAVSAAESAREQG